MNRFIDSTAKIEESFLPKEVKIYRNVSVRNSTLDERTSLGDESIIRNSFLHNRVEIGRRNTIDTVEIGDSTYTGEFCIIKHCQIGKYCSISWNVSIGGANHNIERVSSAPLHRVFDVDAETYKSFEEEKITIGNDVWIAAGAHILRGVSIGDGAVIAANAVVTKDIPPYSIWAGVPAKFIKYRFNETIINGLLEIKWWDWTSEKLEQAIAIFQSELSIESLNKLREINEA